MELILDHKILFLGIAALLGFYMTWGIGANDVANAMGTAVGSGGITIKQAIVIAIIFEFLGAVLAGAHVTNTLQKDIINLTSVLDRPEILVFGMMSALLASSIWIMVASSYGWPVSITHTVIGAIVGFGLIGIGFSAIKWGMLGKILVSWVVSPILSGLLSLAMMAIVHKWIMEQKNPVERARRYAPFLVFLLGFPVSMATFFKGVEVLDFPMSVYGTVALSLFISVAATLVAKRLIHAIVLEDYEEYDLQRSNVEIIFSPLMLFAAAAIAFSHGANDVANGIGPLALIVGIIHSGGNLSQMSTDAASIPFWIFVLGGVGITFGLVTMGYRVMRTIGRKITELTPSRGFCATLATAITVILATRIGFPVSTTQIAIGAVIGVGMYRSIDSVDFRVVGSILVTWMVTFPASLLLSAMFYLMVSGLLVKLNILL